MASYEYKAIRSGGDIIEGTITAKSKSELWRCCVIRNIAR